MPLEIEAKIKVPDLAPVRARLQQAGATSMGQHLETNTFFDTPDRSLLAADQGLRLRINRDLRTDHADFILTHKGPRLPGALKVRDETELTVGDPDAAVVLLERLGFKRVLSFHKKRESWRLHDCRVELDDLPLLGPFVEIEGPDERSVNQVRDALSLGDYPLITDSYIALLLQYLQDHNEPARDILFPASPTIPPRIQII